MTLDHFAAAVTLQERLSRTPRDGAFTCDPDTAKRRFLRWQQTASGNDEALFRRRLELAGLDEESVLHQLSGPAPLEPLPAWVTALAGGLDGLREAESDPCASSCLDPAHPLAFEGAVLPWVQWASATVRYRLDEPDALLGAGAWAEQQRYLLRRLSTLVTPTLMHISNAREIRDQESVTSALLQGQWHQVLETYPVLARLMGTVVDAWCHAVASFTTRLHADWPLLKDTFGIVGDGVDGLELGLSDLHHGGEQVIALTARCGTRFLYKPRDVGVEAGFSAWLEEFNARGLSPTLATLRVVPRTGYGWTEHIAHTSCATPRQVEAYFRRAGMLLCMLHVLGGSDVHAGNVIACGEHPVVVDLDGLLQPRNPAAWPTAELGAPQRAQDLLERSVLCTQFLPFWRLGADQTPFDDSALGGAREEAGNRCLLGCLPQDVELYSGQVIEGFEQAYRLLLEARDSLLAEQRIENLFGPCRTRFINRHTSVYTRLLEHLQTPENLRNGLDWGIELEMLARAGVQVTAGDDTLPPVVRHEQEAMTALDIPYFLIDAGNGRVTTPGGDWVLQHPGTPGFDAVRERMAHLGSDDLDCQKDLIQLSLASRCAHVASDEAAPWILASPRAPAVARLNREVPGQAPCTDALAPELPLESALEIGHQLHQLAIQGDDGSLTWHSLAMHPGTGRYHLEVMGHDLYDGSGGVAIFFSALFAVTGEPRWRACALGALRPLLKHGAHYFEHAGTVARPYLGVGLGLSALVYPCAVCAALLEDDLLAERALACAGWLSPETLARDQEYSVMRGGAGALLTLLALYRRFDRNWLLHHAACAGEQLLSNAVSTENGQIGWRTKDSTPMTGFSYGAAGIAYALSQLARETGDGAFEKAALQAITFENHFYDAASGNWLDPRKPDETAHISMWCHGGAGIGLGRLGMLSATDALAVRRDAERAIDGVLRAGPSPLDQVCCGNFGRIELLLTGGTRLGNPAYTGLARAWCSASIQRARSGGGFALMRGLRGAHHRGFFQGLSGIGYSLLRGYDTHRLPNVLLFE